MTSNLAKKTRELIERLRAHGHQAEADHLTAQLAVHTVERSLLLALREACETLLTAIEAIDPVTETLIAQLRLEVETYLRLPSDSHRA